ncbi:MAG: ABC transporter ATP-binding protein [Candidatus Sungbacteria bacterium]|uniref:ABC transporter ATP-binding protein n=1 Tax=Candidatus Sungiibacteriota bacterium TaxID=2750080 RepID=A0A9D6LSZ0_9BACT|nr:ABC transporter ATP-binding protein [Candidatus Sungbacteria bacterium]
MDGKNASPFHALKDINLEIHFGEFFVLMGPSGSGKSTLLRIFAGIEPAYTGERVLGAGLSQKDISFVFQQFALLPWLTVGENIELGLLERETSEEKRRERVWQELKIFGLEKFANHHPHELSGGMKQRVGIARALATDPKIIFMDEPFSELDSFTGDALRQELLDVWAERKVTIVMVSHNIHESVEMADRIAVLTKPPARVERIIQNHLPRPRNMRSEEVFRLDDELYQLIKP